MPPPVVAIVGNSKSGKTTFIEKLVKELGSRGYRVATIKRVAPEVELDKPGKDSWRHVAAGSLATVVASQKKLILIRAEEPKDMLGESLGLIGENYDIVLAEGFKYSQAPKIEVHRKESGTLLEGITGRFAIITDETLETEARQFSFDDIKDVAGLLEDGFIKPQADRVNLYADGQAVRLTSFPKEIIKNTVTAMASSLKGGAGAKNIELFIKRGDEDKK